MPNLIKKRDGKIDEFKPHKIQDAILSAANAIHLPDAEQVTQQISSAVLQNLQHKYNGNIPNVLDIEETILETARNKGHKHLADVYQGYRDQRTKVRGILAVIGTEESGRDTTDAALLIQSDSHKTAHPWNRKRIVEQLETEANLSKGLAEKIAKQVENEVVNLYFAGMIRIRTRHIRSLVDLTMSKYDGLEEQRKQQTSFSIPAKDLNDIIMSKSRENANVAANNPEAVNLAIAERILKEYSLSEIFSPEVAEAHYNGTIHIHDLGFPARVYCSSHSLEYLKKYGLQKVLANLESKSNSPNAAAVLNQHVQTFLASMQAHYAGALGFGFLNIFYSSLLKRPVDVVTGKIAGKEIGIEQRDLEKLIEQEQFTLDPLSGKGVYFEKTGERKELREVPSKEMEQVAQNLIFAASQNAFSRGGQTLFIDFNIHTGVPKYLKNVPAIGPKGKYIIQKYDGTVELVDDVPRYKNPDNPQDPRNGDADSSGLEGKIITYGDLESTAQKFAKSMLEIWRKGDCNERPFHFPKCDLHIDKDSFSDTKQEEVLDFATQVASENGSVYFMFDRGDDAVLAQCCRLKEKIEDPEMLKYPEKLRFCGFQNITVNLAQAAYKGKNLEGTLSEIDNAMNLALKAHEQKREHMQKLLDTNGSPMRNLGKLSDDGNPYIDLKKATYIIGNIGLNEAVQSLTGKQLHEDEQAYRLGLEIIAHVYNKTREFKEKTGFKFAIEETPAESTTRRLAIVDKKQFPEASKVIKGTEENPYYTNSIHFASNADVGILDRIVGQSRFHQMITSGAIVHAWTGEYRPNQKTIKQVVQNALNNTQCSQFVVSPTYTECDECGTVMPGERELCKTPSCSNSSHETMNKEEKTIHTLTRIVGYNGRIDNWNGSQKQIHEDRKQAEEYYAGTSTGRDMSWLYSPDGHNKLTIIQFGKSNCPTCQNLQDNTEKQIRRLGLESQVDYVVHYLDKPDSKGLVSAAMYDIPLDTVPSIVIAGKKGYWKKTVQYASKCPADACSGEQKPKNELIYPHEVEQQITQRIAEYAASNQATAAA